MSSRAATVISARQAAAQRRRVARRRRLTALAVLAACAAVLLMQAALPLFRKAISELGLPLAYQGVIRAQAAQKHLDPALIAAVIDAETKFDASTSPAGAVGLMQIEPATAQFLAHRSGGVSFTLKDLWTPRVNIAYGSYYLRYLLDQYHGNLVLALAAYNGGETNVDSWLARDRARGRQLTIASIPFPETRAYVAKVLLLQRQYRRTYAVQLGYG